MELPPQETLNAAPQQFDSVMEALKIDKTPINRPEVEKAKQELLALMRETGLSKSQLLEIGKAAEMSIYNKKAYPMFLDRLRKSGLADAEDLRGDIDYRALAIFATAAKMI
jgi:PP-loop superfamily ATP-utilizing enzyme